MVCSNHYHDNKYCGVFYFIRITNQTKPDIEWFKIFSQVGYFIIECFSCRGWNAQNVDPCDFFGPTDRGGWSYRLTPVRPSVRPFVSPELLSITDHRIFPKLGMKLQDNIALRLTKPDFPGKIWFIQ